MQNQISHNALIGKLVIIGISFFDSNDDLIDTFQTHGIIEKSDNLELLRIRKKRIITFFNYPLTLIPFKKQHLTNTPKNIVQLS